MAYQLINHWAASLTALLSPSATTLPVSPAAVTALSTVLGGNTTTLKLKDGVDFEIVTAQIVSGAIQITRAQEGSTAHTFAAGSCAEAVLTAAGLATLICATNCGCVGIELAAGGEIANPDYGLPWVHAWYFTGTGPFTANTITKPSWATVDTSALGQGLLKISGTPNNTTDTTINIIVTGCGGSAHIIDEQITTCRQTGVAA